MIYSDRIDLSWDLPSQEAEAGRLFHLHSAALRTFVMYILKDQAATEDVVQEAFVRLIRHLRSGAPIANAKAWLFTVGRNLASDHLSERARYSSLPVPAGGAGSDERADPAPSAEQICLEAERAKRVQRALKRLSPLESQCLRMRTSGMLYRQIAVALGVTISTVESALARGIRKIMLETC